MSDSLTVVIPCLNDEEEVNRTVWSIRQTAPASVELVVVDDASDAPIKITDAKAHIIRNRVRIGSGASRHLAASKATSPHLLLIDSHMRFETGWFEKIMPKVSDSPKTIWNASGVVLDKECMCMDHRHRQTHGARLVLADNKMVFEGVWNLERQDDDYAISCLMGACYFMHKNWFNHIGGLSSIKTWGSQEPFLSVKCWLAGGEIMFTKSIRIGHQYRSSHTSKVGRLSRSPYQTDYSHVFYNKIRSTFTLLPEDMHKILVSRLQDCKWKRDAIKLFRSDMPEIIKERAYYKSIFTQDIHWLCDKFKIEIPKPVSQILTNARTAAMPKNPAGNL